MLCRLLVLCAAALVLGPGCATDDEAAPAAAPVQAGDDQELIGADPLTKFAGVTELQSACPSPRNDDLCLALNNGIRSQGATAVAWFDKARVAIANRIGSENRESVVKDPAVRWWLRERSLALQIWNHGTARGLNAIDPSQWRKTADAILAKNYPTYSPTAMPLARTWMPPVKKPATACAKATEALLVFPGVVRLGPRQEFKEQIAQIQAAFPCLAVRRVESGSFVSPAVNANKALEAVLQIDKEFGGIPLHMIGYSQGSANALRTLATFPNIAARTKSLLTLNSAARGTEFADTFAVAIDHIDNKATCLSFPSFARPLCNAIAGISVQPGWLVSNALALAAGVPVTELQAFFAAEDKIAPAPSLKHFLIGHLPGVRSLTTIDANKFWTEMGGKLPKHVTYHSFRSVITKPFSNLPPSNALIHALLNIAGGKNPYNDMQVRLQNQSLGGPIADQEVVGRVAEGNHWQWELSPGDVPDAVMSEKMIADMPRNGLLLGHLQALAEVGIVGR